VGLTVCRIFSYFENYHDDAILNLIYGMTLIAICHIQDVTPGRAEAAKL